MIENGLERDTCIAMRAPAVQLVLAFRATAFTRSGRSSGTPLAAHAPRAPSSEPSASVPETFVPPPEHTHHVRRARGDVEIDLCKLGPWPPSG